VDIHTPTGRSTSILFVSAPLGRKNPEAPDQLPRPPVLARQGVFLFLRRPEELKADEQENLITLRQLDPEIALAYGLVDQFREMLRTRTGERLEVWLEQARTSQIRELQGFAASVERDKAAVMAGLTLHQNNGLVEGHVNKLKLIKRMGYGRASISLLRKPSSSCLLVRKRISSRNILHYRSASELHRECVSAMTFQTEKGMKMGYNTNEGGE
jgi:hypothetical protein